MSRWRSHDHVAEAKAQSRFRDDDVTKPTDILREAARGGRYAPRAGVVGARYGELTLREEWDRSRQGIRWLCDCVCGRSCVRRCSRLNALVRAGRSPACSECLREERRGRTALLSHALTEAYRRQFVDYGTLWRDWQTCRLMEQVREDLSAAYGAIDDVMSTSDMVLAAGAPYSFGDVAHARRVAMVRGRPDLAPDYSWVDDLYGEDERGVSEEEARAIGSLSEAAQ